MTIKLSFIERTCSWFARTDRTALMGLLIANLLPLLLCLIFGWEIGNLIMFYWWENIVIGMYAILRLVFASGNTADAIGTLSGIQHRNTEHAKRDETTLKSRSIRAEKFFLIPFFVFHYFFFCLIHGVFLLVLLQLSFASGHINNIEFPLNGNPAVNFWNALPQGGGWALLALVISHGISFTRNYLINGEYQTTSPALEMFRPYGRIVILHVCIVLGGFIVMLLGSSTPFVLIFVIFKTAVDATIHSHNHIKRGATIVAIDTG